MDRIRSLQIIRKFSPAVDSIAEKFIKAISCNLISAGQPTAIAATNALCSVESEIIQKVPIRRFDYFYPCLNLTEEARSAFDRNSGDPYSWQLYRYLIKNKEIDILHSHSCGRLGNIVRLAARKKKIPYIISLYTAHSQVLNRTEQSWKLPTEGTLNYGKLLDFLLKNKRVLSDADGILCLGYDSCQELRQKFPDKIIEFIPEAVDVAKFKVESTRHYRKRYQIDPNADIILCVNEIDPQKNQLKLVELANLLKQKRQKIHLILIGRIAEAEYFQQLRQKITEMDLENCVTLLTELTDEDPEFVKAYQAADFFMLPSLQEPDDKSILEAWASRLPVIAHKTGIVQNLIISKHNGLLFENNSLSDLAAQYYFLKDHPDLRVKLIHNAYEEVCSSCSCSAVCQKVLDFYEKVIDKYNERKQLK